MKKISLFLVCLIVLCVSRAANAAITVTPGSGGTNICSALAVGGSAPAFTTLGTITLTEGLVGDMTNGFHLLVINAPAGWKFNTVAPTLGFTPGRNVTAVNLISITAASLTMSINVGCVTLIDAVTIAGLQVEATATGSGAGNITESAAAGLTGINGATNFGSLSLAPTPGAVTVSGGGVFCDNATINASLVGPGTIYFEDATSGGTSTATPSASQVISLQGTHTYYFRAESAAGGCWGAEGSAAVTINITPAPITVTTLTTASICLGDSAGFVASTPAPTVEILQQDFNSGLGAWTITSTAGIAASFWQITNPPGHLSAVPGDGSPYLEASPDATGSAALPTNTIVTSPSFSTVGYTSAAVSFNQYYNFYPFDTSVSIEYSIDGGANWVTILNQFTLGTNAGTTTWVSTAPTTTLAFPAGALNQPDVMLRWNYNSDWGWYWAIDNIAVNGTPTLSYNWAGVGAATGLSCTTCDTTMITPTALGANDYTVATTVAGCTSSGNTTVTVSAIPTVYSVTGGGPFCAGGAGSDVGLMNSDLGVDYQLYNGAATVGAPISGLGMPIDFGFQNVAGTYTVLATNTAAGCTANMLDSAVITINPLPIIKPITGDPTVCIGDSKPLLDSTAAGVWSTDDPLTATVSAGGIVTGIALGSTTINYAVTSAAGCSDSATFNIAVGNAMPAVAISPMMATICHNNPVNITTTPVGASYQWEVNGAVIPGATDANFTADSAGTYRLVLDNGTCTVNEPVVSILPNPNPMISYNTSGHYLYTSTFVTYQWLRNGVAVTGATTGIYPLTVSGMYRVVVKDVNGCMDTSAVYNYISTGVSSVVAGNNINVYPNPATSVLHIDAPCSVNVHIISPDGRVVMEQKDAVDMSIAHLANGVYMIMVYDGSNTLLKTTSFSKIN